MLLTGSAPSICLTISFTLSGGGFLTLFQRLVNDSVLDRNKSARAVSDAEDKDKYNEAEVRFSILPTVFINLL